MKKFIALVLAVFTALSLVACGSTKTAEPLKIAVPDDATNLARAIKLVEKAGFIEVDPSAGYSPEFKDVTKYVYNIELVPTQANTLPATLADFAASTINGTYAVPAGLVPSKDALIIEKQDTTGTNPYVNVVVARTEDKDNPVYKKIVEAVNQQTVADYLLVAYNEMYFPAFDYKQNNVSADFIKEVNEYKSSKEGKQVVKIGVCGSNNRYWNEAQRILDKQNAGIYLELVEFSAYNLPNQALANKEIDLNSFQHIAYLNKEISATGYKLSVIGDTLIAPLSLYSKKYDSLDALKKACAK